MHDDPSIVDALIVSAHELSLWLIQQRCSSCMDWTKPLASLTLFETNKTKKKRRDCPDLTWKRERACDRVSTCVTPAERLRQSLRKQTTNEVARRGLDGKEIVKKITWRCTPWKKNSWFLFLDCLWTWSKLYIYGACMSTSAKCATTVDSRTRVRVKSWTCRKLLALVDWSSISSAAVAVRRRRLLLTRFSCILGMDRKKALVSLTGFETKMKMRVHIGFACTCKILRNYRANALFALSETPQHQRTLFNWGNANSP